MSEAQAQLLLVILEEVVRQLVEVNTHLAILHNYPMRIVKEI